MPFDLETHHLLRSAEQVLITVPDSIRQAVLEHFIAQNSVRKASESETRRVVEETLSPRKARYCLREILQFVHLDQNSRVLEVGSGYSTMIVLLNKLGVDAYGIEPGTEAYSSHRLAHDILQNNGLDGNRILNAVGEHIPFRPNSFDVVYSTQTIEHTRNPGAVLHEICRVLKPGGTAVLVFPNYGSWWEGHYGMLFLPHCPKWVFKIIVAAKGQDHRYVDTLQFITYAKLRRWILPIKDQITIRTFGLEVWKHRVQTLEYEAWASTGRIKAYIKIAKKLRLTGMLLWLGERLHWETPFIFVFQKNR